jgi:hypothetical protein
MTGLITVSRTILVFYGVLLQLGRVYARERGYE